VYFNGASYLATTYNFDSLVQYTVFAVSRYTGPDTYARVVSSLDRNWLFGHWGNCEERFYAEGWIQQGGSNNNTNWYVHAGTMNNDWDPKASFWKNGVLIVANSIGSDNVNYKPGPIELGGCLGMQEMSKCEVAEVIIFDKVLSPAELNQVGAYLAQKYSLLSSAYPPYLADTCPTNGMVLWLKPDSSIQTNNSGYVTNWVDQSGGGLNAVQATVARQPLYSANAINGFPAATFDGVAEPNGDRLVYGDLGIQTVFIVNRVGVGCVGLAGIIGKQGVDISIRRASTLAWAHPDNGGSFSNPGGSLFWVDGISNPNANENVWHVLMAERGSGTLTCDSIGGGYWGDRNYKGDIAEIIAYNRALSTLEINRVGAYLARKYALPTYYQWTSGKSYVWVQIPQYTNNCSIWAYWGTPNMPAPSYCSDGSVWLQGFDGVWHMGQNGRKNSASAISSYLTQAGTVNNTVGQIDGCDDFDGTSGYLQTIITNASVRTLSAWIRPRTSDDVAQIESVLDTDVGGQFGTGWGLDNGKITAILDERFWTTTKSAVLGQWQYVSLVYDTTNARVFWNGQLADSLTYTQGPLTVANYRIGRSNANALYFDGGIDEVRISNLTRSSNWLWACYMNQASNDAMNVYLPVMGVQTLDATNVTST
jgi:hypothetical protein